MYKSGMTRMFLSIKIWSAAGVVGPLAASAIIYASKVAIDNDLPLDCTTYFGTNFMGVIFIDDFFHGGRHEYVALFEH